MEGDKIERNGEVERVVRAEESAGSGKPVTYVVFTVAELEPGAVQRSFRHKGA